MTTTGNGVSTAHIETLTAEVRTLVVGSRQVTLSVYRQLDCIDQSCIVAWGRVNYHEQTEEDRWPSRMFEHPRIWVVGADGISGALVRSSRRPPGRPSRAGSHSDFLYAGRLDSWRYDFERWAQWSRLPLIVLAGLR